MHHAGSDKAEIDLFVATIVGDRTNRIVCVALRHIFVVDVRICDHGLYNLIQVNGELCKIFRIGVR